MIEGQNVNVVNQAALIECAERVLFQCWQHDDQSLADAEVELGVSYELFECDLEQSGESEQFFALPEHAQAATFFAHLQPERADATTGSCLADVPACDWILVWVRYLANILRGISREGEGMEQAIALIRARLEWAVLASLVSQRRH